MNKNNSLKGFVLLTLAGALISAGARICAVLLCLDTGYGVYERGSVLPTVTHILTFAICAALAVYGLIKAKNYPRPAAPNVGSPTVFTSCVLSFLIAAQTLLSLYNIVIAGASPDKFTVLKIVFSIPSVIFFLSLIKTDVKQTPALAFMSFFPTAWFAVELIEVYFDKSLLITSPAKTFHELTLLSVMLYLLCESRFVLSRSDGRLFFVTSGIAPVVILTSALPSLILPDRLLIGSSDSFLICAIECAAALFILTRSWAFAKEPTLLPEPAEAPAPETPAES